MMRLALLRRLGIDPAVAAKIALDPGLGSPSEVFAASASVPTASASRYLQQLCKHWAHKLAVEFTPEHGTIVFPMGARGGEYPGDALVTFDARADALEVRIHATSPERRDNLKGAVARHLDRFAFREAPLPFDWRDL